MISAAILEQNPGVLGSSKVAVSVPALVHGLVFLGPRQKLLYLQLSHLHSPH
jgi:hypothetical protein